jgi:hypothetical protein
MKGQQIFLLVIVVPQMAKAYRPKECNAAPCSSGVSGDLGL